MIRTSQEVRNELLKRGLSIADWARQNGFSPELVHQVINSNKIPVRGKSHEIAVRLGLKDGIIEPSFTFEKIKEKK